MEKNINIFHKWGKAGIISVLLVFSFLAGNSTGFAKNNTTVQQHVLSATTHITPSPTTVPTPTTPPITIINNIIFPTQTPATITPVVTPTPVVLGASPSPTPQPKVDGSLTPTPVISPTASPTPTVIPTATPAPVSQSVGVAVTYAGEHADSTYTVSITSGETAWQAVQDAVGLVNLQYTDYGGSLGILITGFNGVIAASNQYYDFQVNGTSSNVGVSSYTVNDHDVLKFVLTSF